MGELLKLEAETILLPLSHYQDTLENGNACGEGAGLLFMTHRDLVKLGRLSWENFPPVSRVTVTVTARVMAELSYFPRA